MNWSPNDYKEANVIARETGHELLQRLDWMTIKPNVILDLGCATGAMSERLKNRYPQASVLACDLSQQMLNHAYQYAPSPLYFCADGLRLPLLDQSVDLFFSNLVLPWLDDFKLALLEWRRVLRHDGLLTFTALGLDTLKEWRTSTLPSLEPLLADMHDIGDLLLQAGFTDPVLDVSYFTINYKNIKRLEQDLYATGMWAAQKQPFPLSMTVNPPWEVTYEIIYGHAFAAPLAAQDKPNEVSIPISQLRKALKVSA